MGRTTILTLSKRTISEQVETNSCDSKKGMELDIWMSDDQHKGKVKTPSKDKKMDTVLVVEDSRAMQRTLQRLLEADSLNVQIASDGISGLESFRKQPPSAVLLDLKLPGLSGKELCREFKTIAASVPIIVLSANAAVEDKVLLLELGADDYITKPFSPRELLARVRRAMRRGEAQQISNVPAKAGSHEVLIFGDTRVDFTSMEAAQEGKPVTLTAQEL